MNISPSLSSKQALKYALNMTSGITRDSSLLAIEQYILEKADQESKTDPHLAELVSRIIKILLNKKDADDVVSSSQAFEVYGEIKVYRHLKHHGYSPECFPTKHGSASPDFKCLTPDGKVFYVEVKSFDVVHGEFAQTKMLEDGLDAAIEMEIQVKRGDKVACSAQVYAPYGELALGESQNRVIIETIERKVRGNFKSSQFREGPTFAVAVIDKLIIPGRQCALSPYYHEEIFQGSACLSGSLWASAYAEPGYVMLDHYEFEGKPTISGRWEREGYFTAARSHPAQGIIFMDQGLSAPLVYGLTNEYARNFENWDIGDTEWVLSTLCDAWNCKSNTNGYSIANYDSRKDFPPNEESKSAWDTKT